ncbi:MAG: 5-(carboxyamino)imidazole ribonucleotide synthase [Cyanothece sp. SIO1E1]|nr:5-(carboxyamino)imidazole ribonucleotide synthase [Cyanothece sp. SIO1E1]
MMAKAARALGLELIVQTPQSTDPAVAIATDTVLATVDDAAATAALAAQCQVITFENEFVDLPALLQLEAQGVRFYPGLAALMPLLDKYEQRLYLQNVGLPTPRFTALEQLPGQVLDHQILDQMLSHASVHSLGLPLVLKTRRHGYDGQGTFILQDRAALALTWQKLGYQPVLLEEFVPFERELAVIAARSLDGDVVIYPVVETQQEHQVCRRVLVPTELKPGLEGEINAIAQTLLNSLQFVGIVGIELFLTAAGQVLVNEIAPRTHNSGHYTLDACETSQFEQQLRAVCHLPLGRPNLHCNGAVMVNLLGYEQSLSDYQAKRQRLAEIPQAYVYWYGKTESRPGRKLGHVTILSTTATATSQPELAQQLQRWAQQVESIWYER